MFRIFGKRKVRVLFVGAAGAGKTTIGAATAQYLLDKQQDTTGMVTEPDYGRYSNVYVSPQLAKALSLILMKQSPDKSSPDKPEYLNYSRDGYPFYINFREGEGLLNGPGGAIDVPGLLRLLAQYDIAVLGVNACTLSESLAQKTLKGIVAELQGPTKKYGFQDAVRIAAEHAFGWDAETLKRSFPEQMARISRAPKTTLLTYDPGRINREARFILEPGDNPDTMDQIFEDMDAIARGRVKSDLGQSLVRNVLPKLSERVVTPVLKSNIAGWSDAIDYEDREQALDQLWGEVDRTKLRAPLTPALIERMNPSDPPPEKVFENLNFDYRGPAALLVGIAAVAKQIGRIRDRTSKRI